MGVQNALKKDNYIIFLVLLLTLISSQIISDRTIQHNVSRRISIQDSIIAGIYEAPYQYRVMKVILGKSAESIVSKFVSDPLRSHIISYHIVIFIVFFGIFILMYNYLKLFFSINVIMIGMLLLQLIIPLGITSIWEEGDYITLFFFLIGFNLMFRSKDIYLPLIIFIGVINRDQIVYMVIFYIAFLINSKSLFKMRNIVIIVLCLAGYFAAYYLLRLHFGFKENFYTTELQISTNIFHWKSIFGLWIEQVLVFIVLSLIAYKRTGLFFRISFISLLLYVLIFFFNSILSQVAKILPAYLILIPMSLVTLSGEKMKYYERDNV